MAYRVLVRTMHHGARAEAFAQVLMGANHTLMEHLQERHPHECLR